MTGLALRQVKVTFRKQLSDGNYGTEAAEVTFEDYCQDDDDESYMAEALMMKARRQVHAELARSPSERVRRAINDVDKDAVAFAYSNAAAEERALAAAADDDGPPF